MRVLITGAAGMLGQKLSAALRSQPFDRVTIDALDLFDVVATTVVDPVDSLLVGDLAEVGVAEDLIARQPDVVFHLAGVVSGEAEANFAKGTRVIFLLCIMHFTTNIGSNKVYPIHSFWLFLNF